jgi:hypothetical protein
LSREGVIIDPDLPIPDALERNFEAGEDMPFVAIPNYSIDVDAGSRLIVPPKNQSQEEGANDIFGISLTFDVEVGITDALRDDGVVAAVYSRILRVSGDTDTIGQTITVVPAVGGRYSAIFLDQSDESGSAPALNMSHEIGHALGLGGRWEYLPVRLNGAEVVGSKGHSEDMRSLMYPYAPALRRPNGTGKQPIDGSDIGSPDMKDSTNECTAARARAGGVP